MVSAGRLRLDGRLSHCCEFNSCNGRTDHSGEGMKCGLLLMGSMPPLNRLQEPE